MVLEALPLLKDTIPGVVYLVAGDGTDRPRLEAKARSLGVEDDVVFTGYIAEEEKADHYRLADVFVLAGRGEGFGTVLLEAMACGVPVVASKLDGSAEAVRGGELGALVDPGEPEDLTRGILEALARPRGVVPRGLGYFSYENFARRCHEFLDRVLPADVAARASR